MAHEVESMLYVGAAPWHGLGHRFIEPPSLDQAIISAGLDWRVTVKPAFTEDGRQLPGNYTERVDTGATLGMVGPSYEPLQNSESFEFFRPFIDNGQAVIETAGSLREGRRVFVLCKAALDPMVIKGSDTVEKYILLSNSHDGTLAVRVGFTPVRVVCANTLALAHGDSASKLIRVKHTKNVLANIEAIREIMNVANAEFEATAEQYRKLANQDINTADLEKYVKQVFTLPKQIQTAESNAGGRVYAQILELFEAGRGNNMAEIRGTWWAAYNAVTEYIQHERGKDEARRLNEAWFGVGAELNRKALTTALQLAA